QSAMQISYINPCPSYTRISDTYGARINPITNLELFHNGVDLAAAKDEDIVAAAGGIVCKTGYDSYYGNHVVIYHGMENFTYYAHCAEIFVSEGDRVESGQKIAAVGSTGRSTGPHLHFMTSDNGEYVEPVFQ
ncbi:MAG: M23 family metallopeptidase, partial [Lachnospiraceae bacterium]|nr:M23 family metallopeptidase [Lachnospiraceae bacterium]